MATNQQTLLRQWHMLRMIPRYPHKATVQQILERLSAAEFAVTGRTVQRDLQELSQVFPLMVDDRNRPFGWSWQQDAPNFDLPGLSVPEALALTLVQQYLGNSLPPSMLEALQPHFRSANQTLASAHPEAKTSAWLNKVRTIAPMQRLLPPSIKEACQRTVYEALMRDQQLKLSYLKRNATKPIMYESVHPLAVVQRGQLIYLVCMFSDYEDVRTLPLHRIIEAEMLFEQARKKAKFSIDAYIESGQLGVRKGEPITLQAVFLNGAGEHLQETPICKNQKLEELEGGSLRLTATVPNTQELFWWLLGFGDGVRVEGPEELRQKMRTTTKNMLTSYGS